MGDLDIKNHIDLVNDKVTTISPGEIKLRNVTSKPPVREDYSSDAAFTTALENHFRTTPHGIEVESQGMTITTNSIIFSDTTVMTTAAVGGNSNLNVVPYSNHSQLTKLAPVRLANKFSTGIGDYGIDTESTMPGPNGSGNSLPEQCNSMVFLKLNADFSSLLGITTENVTNPSSVPCYIPCYFNLNSSIIDPPDPDPNLQIRIGNGAWSNGAVNIELFEDNMGVDQTVGPPYKDLNKFPSTVIEQLRIEPQPSDGNPITLNVNTAGYDSIATRFAFTNFNVYSNKRLTTANNYTVSWTFSVIDDPIPNNTALGFLAITTQDSTTQAFNSISNRLNIAVYDYDDSVIIRDPLLSTYVRISDYDATNRPQFWERFTENSPTFNVIVEYVEFGQTSTDITPAHSYEQYLSALDQQLVNGWRTNTPYQIDGSAEQLESGIDLKTTQLILQNVYITPGTPYNDPNRSRLVGGNANDIFNINIQTRDDGDDNTNNNKTYPMLFIIYDPIAQQAKVIGTNRVSPNRDTLFELNAYVGGSSVVSSATIAATSNLQTMTWMLYSTLYDADTDLPVANPNDNKLVVTVLNTESGNKYYIDEQGPAPNITLTRGETYTIDQSNSSNSGHPFRISTVPDGTHNGGNQYAVISTVDEHTSIFIVPMDAPNTLYYYCCNHTKMGGTINVTPTTGGGGGGGGGGSGGDIDEIEERQEN